eukprot:2674546-Amphidinium_carterae.2
MQVEQCGDTVKAYDLDSPSKKLSNRILTTRLEQLRGTGRDLLFLPFTKPLANQCGNTALIEGLVTKPQTHLRLVCSTSFARMHKAVALRLQDCVQ